MIVAWRIDKASRSPSQAFSGEGAGARGGRWNRPGTRIVYSSQSLSLAALELFVHLGPEAQAIRFVSYRIELPEAVAIRHLSEKDLPKDWRSEPARDPTRSIGSDWARNRDTAVLRVPSVVVPVESNYLLNPLHPAFERIKVAEPEPFQFDPRLWKAADV